MLCSYQRSLRSNEVILKHIWLSPVIEFTLKCQELCLRTHFMGWLLFADSVSRGDVGSGLNCDWLKKFS